MATKMKPILRKKFRVPLARGMGGCGRWRVAMDTSSVAKGEADQASFPAGLPAKLLQSHMSVFVMRIEHTASKGRFSQPLLSLGDDMSCAPMRPSP